MYAKYPISNDGCDWEVIESITNIFPELDIKFSLDLIIEPVDLINFRALVISS